MSLTVRIARWCWVLSLAGMICACGERADDAGDSRAKAPREPEATPAPSSAEGTGGRVARTLPIPAGAVRDRAGASPTSADLSAPPTESGTGTLSLVWRAPASWISEPPASPMRRAQYRVPGTTGDGECAVFYFGPGQGGDPMSNAERWAGQFTLPDGGPARDGMKTRTYEVGEVSVLEVEIAGTYDGGMTMTADPPPPKPGSMLLGAIAQGPDANWFFKLTGPEATVLGQRAAFAEMIRSLRPGNERP